MDQSIVLNINKRPRDSSNYVIIEQEPWDPYIDALTKMGAVAYLNKLLYNSGDGAKENCSKSIVSSGINLFVYPSKKDLVYRFGVTNGRLSKPSISVLEYTQTINCNLKTKISTDYPALSITGYEWVGEVFNELGEMVPPPSVNILNSKEIEIHSKVYGTILVSYNTVRHTYKYYGKNREGAVENKSQSFAYATWTGGNAYKEIDIPDMADEGMCNNSYGSGKDSFTGGDDVPGPVDPEDKNNWIDYCTQLPIDSPVIG